MSKKIGLFICNCGENISSRIDTQSLLDQCKNLPDIACAEIHDLWCSKEGCAEMQRLIKTKRLSHAVVAACSPKQHQHTFSRVMTDSGSNPYLLQMANIREQVAWITPDRNKALAKATAVTKAALARVRRQEPLEKTEMSCNPDVVVVGAGIAGLSAALTLAQKDRNVYLVEKKPWIGGKVAAFEEVFPSNECAPCMLEPLIDEVLNHQQIKLFTNSEVNQVRGFFGNFEVHVQQKPRYITPEKCFGCNDCFAPCPVSVPNSYNGNLSHRQAIYTAYPGIMPNVPVIDPDDCLQFTDENCQACQDACPFGAIDFSQPDRDLELKAGAVIVATGYELFEPASIDRFNVQGDNFLTSYQFERLLSSTGPTEGIIQAPNGKAVNSIAFIHCAGSRDSDNISYCSAICCAQILKQMEKAKNKLKDVRLYDYHSDWCLPGKNYQGLLLKSQTNGNSFLRQQDHRAIRVKMKKGKFEISAESTNGKVNPVVVDMVVLGTGIVPAPDHNKLSEHFGIDRDGHGFFASGDELLSPASTCIRGVYAAGCATGPKDIAQSVMQAQAAAGDILKTLIPGARIELETCTCAIDEEYCSGCRTCISVCPYKAISHDDEKNRAIIHEVMCRGCGICAAACPSGIIHNKHFSSSQINAEIEGILS